MEARKKIFDTLVDKGCMKQEVYRTTLAGFTEMKAVIEELANELKAGMAGIDETVRVEFEDRGDFEVRLKLGGDIIIFMMHTNVFDFDKSHGIWNQSYVKDDPSRSYCGMISAYNFLADSFKYNRERDLGYLIARMFVNKESHFFVEGKRQLGFLYNDLSQQQIDRESITSVVESAVLYSLNFDLLTPPYQNMSEVSVFEIIEVARAARLRTGKRLGFRFQADSDEVE